jgi:hypothetical protein
MWVFVQRLVGIFWCGEPRLRLGLFCILWAFFEGVLGKVDVGGWFLVG